MRGGLKSARIKKGVSTVIIAEYLGITERGYRHIENSTRGTSENNWLKLYEYFDKEVPLHELMETTPTEK